MQSLLSSLSSMLMFSIDTYDWLKKLEFNLCTNCTLLADSQILQIPSPALYCARRIVSVPGTHSAWAIPSVSLYITSVSQLCLFERRQTCPLANNMALFLYLYALQKTLWLLMSCIVQVAFLVKVVALYQMMSTSYISLRTIRQSGNTMISRQFSVLEDLMDQRRLFALVPMQMEDWALRFMELEWKVNRSLLESFRTSKKNQREKGLENQMVQDVQPLILVRGPEMVVVSRVTAMVRRRRRMSM